MTLAEHKRLEREKREKEKLNPKPHQKISNTFIENTIKNANVNALKTIYYLASILETMDEVLEIKKTKKEIEEDSETIVSLAIDTREMLKYTNMSLIEIKRNLKAMQETSITFKNEKEKWEMGMNLLPLYKFIYGKHKIRIHIYKKIAQMVIDAKKNYTRFNTKDLMKLKSKHSLRMLPLLHKISGYDKDIPKRKHMTLKELNEFFGTKYKNFYEIERSILLPVKLELDKNSKLSFIFDTEYEQIMIDQGRPRIENIVIDLVKK